MDTSRILDYSAGYPGAAAIARAGFAGVIRYLAKEGGSRVRALTAGEVADMRAQGRSIAIVYQHVDRFRVTQGADAGRHDAQWALAQARAVGIEPRCVYFAVDFDADPPTVAEYFRGAAGGELGLARVGGYGSFRVVGHLFDRTLITWGWQTAAWSGGRREARAHLFQRVGQITVDGIVCDINEVLRTDHGQHPPPEDEMVTQTDANLIRDTILNSTIALKQRAPDGSVAPKTVNVPLFEVHAWDDMRAQNVSALLSALTVKVDALAGAVADDLTGEEALAALNARVDAGMAVLRDQQRAELEQLRSALEAAQAQQLTELLDALRRIEAALARDDANEAAAIVTELAARLRPAA